MFKDFCHQLCLVTTVSKYNILKGKLDELSKLAPELRSGLSGGTCAGAIYLAHLESQDCLESASQNKATHPGSPKSH